jgi:hypothetical protein
MKTWPWAGSGRNLQNLVRRRPGPEDGTGIEHDVNAMGSLQKTDLLGSAQEWAKRHGALPNLVKPPESHIIISKPTFDPKQESVERNLSQKR